MTVSARRLDSVLAAQAMFPVTSRDEMRGYRGELDVFGQPNELAVAGGLQSSSCVDALMARLLAIPRATWSCSTPLIPMCRQMNSASSMPRTRWRHTEIAVFTFEDAPFDRYIQGDKTALSDDAKQGALLFYGEGRAARPVTRQVCSPTRSSTTSPCRRSATARDANSPSTLGRARETATTCDRYAFRTPPLRNVAITGPWMHNGAFTTLERDRPPPPRPAGKPAKTTTRASCPSY
ncbi:MAG: hypothetical protein MZV65_36100 [Chromatiales bacterium]|nr:hypothetical protein [Chromatiales bacterium]